MRRPALLSAPLRVPALILAALCWLGMALLGVRVAGGHRAGPFDARLIDVVQHTVGRAGMPAELLVSPTDPVAVAGFILLGLALALRRRSWALAALTALAPTVGELIGDMALKPVFGRYYHGYLSYPSGHTIAGTTTLTVLLLLVAAGARPLVRALAIAVWALLCAALAVGLVALGYHYPTDVAGGFLLALGTVLPLAVVLGGGDQDWGAGSRERATRRETARRYFLR